jgi:hypothetical protein
MNGLWTAEFGSTAGIFGGGVVIFSDDGTLMGGDSWYFYAGEYQREGNELTATLRVSPFIQGGQSVFGTTGQQLTLDLRGQITGNSSAIGQGTARGIANMNFGVKLTKRI